MRIIPLNDPVTDDSAHHHHHLAAALIVVVVGDVERTGPGMNLSVHKCVAGAWVRFGRLELVFQPKVTFNLLFYINWIELTFRCTRQT